MCRIYNIEWETHQNWIPWILSKSGWIKIVSTRLTSTCSPPRNQTGFCSMTRFYSSALETAGGSQLALLHLNFKILCEMMECSWHADATTVWPPLKAALKPTAVKPPRIITGHFKWHWTQTQTKTVWRLEENYFDHTHIKGVVKIISSKN